MSGYEVDELVEIEDKIDALVSPTSEDVWQATRPYDARAIASVAATRAGGGGGGSLPSQWTVGGDGSLAIAPDAGGGAILELDAPAGANGTAFIVKDENGNTIFEAQAESGIDAYAQAANIAALDVHSVADADDGSPVFRVRPDLNGSHTAVFEVDSNGHCKAQSLDAFAIAMQLFGFTGQIVAILEVRDSGGNKLFQVTPDGNIHIKTGGTVIADL